MLFIQNIFLKLIFISLFLCQSFSIYASPRAGDDTTEPSSAASASSAARPLDVGPQFYHALRFLGSEEAPEVTFYAYELVLVLQKIMREVISKEEDKPAVPLYATYEEQIEGDFHAMKEQWYTAAATHLGEDKTWLSLFLECFYEFGPNLVLGSKTGFTSYQSTMRRIKGIAREAGFITSDFDEHILPMQVVPRPTPSGWLAAARYMARKEEAASIDRPPEGWWVHAGGRLIRVRNSPNEREHFYVSDHGAKSDVVRDTKADFLTFDPKNHDALYVLKFWRWFREQISEEERERFQQRFILYLHQGRGGTFHKNEFICFALAYPPSYQKRLFELGSLDAPGFSVGFGGPTKAREADPWVFPLSETEHAAHDAIPSHERLAYEEIYALTLERIRFRGDIQVPVFFGDMFGLSERRVGLSPFFTQIDQIFHPEDADRFKTFYILKELKKKITGGLQEYLFRPLHSFGSPDKGSSYNDFAKELLKYRGKAGALSDKDLIQEMRSVLAGRPITDSDTYFIPNLSVAWFLSEVARNESSLPVGLMLLDLMESGVPFIDRDGANMYDLKHALIHPRKPADSRDKLPITDMYGDSKDKKGKDLDLSIWDGMHPMAHAGSRAGGVGPLGGEELSTVRQKEGHIIIDWLHKILGEDLICEPVCGITKKPTKKDFLEIRTLFNAQEKPSSSIASNSQLNRKWGILQVIIEYFRERMESFIMMLGATSDSGSSSGEHFPPPHGGAGGGFPPFAGGGGRMPASSSAAATAYD